MADPHIWDILRTLNEKIELNRLYHLPVLRGSAYNAIQTPLEAGKSAS